MKWTIGIIGIIVATYAYGADPETRDIATSQKYVEEQLLNRQDTIPAVSGEKVVTPTGVRGTIGEREIKTDLGDESTNTDDTGITTIETVNTALGNKQERLKLLPSVNVVTYTGTNDNPNGYTGRGIVTTTPIYDETTNTYGNGLVRAGTLNNAVASATSGALTQVDPNGNESNTGGLWRINDLNNVLPTTVYLPAHIGGTQGDCYYPLAPYNGGYLQTQLHCSSTLYNSLQPGDWGAVFPYETGITYGTTCGGTNSTACGKEVHGTSVCSSVRPDGRSWAPITDSSKIATLNQESITQRNGGDTTGTNCYCKLLNPSVAGAPWVYRTNYTECPAKCAHECGWYVPISQNARSGLFSGGNVD